MSDIHPIVFLSYAHVDNYVVEDSSLGWVDRVHECLDIELQQMGLDFKLWRDNRDLEKDSFFDESILSAVADSKVLLAVLSPVYPKRDYCLKELNHFINNSNGGPPDSVEHVVKIIKQPLEASGTTAMLPEDIDRSLGFQFFSTNRRENKIQKYVEIDGSVKLEAEFWDTIQDLGLAVKRRLADVASSNEPVVKFEGPVVFLAESDNEQDDSYRNLKASLIADGCKVLPETRLPGDHQALVDQIQKQLAEADFSIHMLGSRGGFSPEGADDQTIAQIQLESAMRRAQKGESFNRLIWIDPDSAEPDNHQNSLIRSLESGESLLESDDLIKEPLELFKLSVNELLKTSNNAAPEKESNVLTSDHNSSQHVFLVYQECDTDVGSSFRKNVFDKGVEVFRANHAKPDPFSSEEIKDFVVRSRDIVILYGASDEAWVQLTLMTMKDIIEAEGIADTRIVVLLVGENNSMKADFMSRHADAIVDATNGAIDSIVDSLLTRTYS